MFHAERPLEAYHPPAHSSLYNHVALSSLSSTAVLRLHSLCKSYDGKAVVSDASLSIQPGIVYGVIGRSGAGKSTLLRMAALLESPDSGLTLYSGSPVSRLRGQELLLARRRAGVVFQSFNLFCSRTAAGNVAFPLEAAGTPKTTIKKRVASLLDLVGLIRSS